MISDGIEPIYLQDLTNVNFLNTLTTAVILLHLVLIALQKLH